MTLTKALMDSTTALAESVDRSYRASPPDTFEMASVRSRTAIQFQQLATGSYAEHPDSVWLHLLGGELLTAPAPLEEECPCVVIGPLLSIPGPSQPWRCESCRSVWGVA